MIKPRVFALLPLVLLTSCNEAESVSNSGKASHGYWVANYKLLSYRVNGAAIDTARIPAEEMQKLNADVGCSAMNFSSKEDISQMMTTYNNATSQCTITSMSEVGEKFSFEGYCEMPDVAGLRHKAMFSASGQQSPNEILIEASGRSYLANPQSGASNVMESELKGTLTRREDC
jgi:hypothetical protein